MIRRLVDSVNLHGRSFDDMCNALHAYELDYQTAGHAVSLAIIELEQCGVPTDMAMRIADCWVTVGDYLLKSPENQKADFVLGNPPYVRYDDLPDGLFTAYRHLYPTMSGRCDIYVGFIEAGLRQLSDGGTLAFICADRWMRSAYGAQLRRLVAEHYSVEVVVEMHDASAFEREVSAYPAVIVLRKAPQKSVIVASAGTGTGSSPRTRSLADSLVNLADTGVEDLPGFKATRVDGWFEGMSPWPAVEPDRLELLQRLESEFRPLEDERTGTRIGIGVATGNDKVFVTTDATVVEDDRFLPLAMSADTRTGHMKWSGHFLINPWLENGELVDLESYPRLRQYFEDHGSQLKARNIARRRTNDWYRTIDRVKYDLTKRNKLYFPDMKMMSNPTLDRGLTYPHHNLYYLVSDSWDLEVLGGLLLSRIAQLFIEAYCVKMRGGTLRFQAQYLRRIRVPEPTSVSEALAERLRTAFRNRDAEAATKAAIEAYGISEFAELLGC